MLLSTNMRITQHELPSIERKEGIGCGILIVIRIIFEKEKG
jgi:hypothetical protein